MLHTKVPVCALYVESYAHITVVIEAYGIACYAVVVFQLDFWYIDSTMMYNVHKKKYINLGNTTDYILFPQSNIF